MFDPQIIDFTSQSGGLMLKGLPILVDASEHESIRIAVSNLAQDLEKVTGSRPAVWTEQNHKDSVPGVILIGSLKRSKFIHELAKHGTHCNERIAGKWESFYTTVQESPWAWAKQILVICGSDVRGTIFGVYTLSEQIGVSPWYWWADVPVRQREHVYALGVTTYQGEPSVKYRGLFINDEAPALTDWVHEKFGKCYNSKFYEKFFELLLRLKANFFWPAMWSGSPEPGSSFFTDDPANQRVADAYGIVVSTSHHEPMQRATNEWRRAGTGPWVWEANKKRVTDFFLTGAERSKNYESIFTLGMRGEGDGTIESNDPINTLREVIQTQRGIIKQVFGKEDAVSQVMALYKEVQEYYENGLEIPDDVTLLFADDNFGNIRRLPTAHERKRRGGIGMYYHLEYVGHPRSYKWLNTNSCGKIQQQLETAHSSGINQIWIFNVGDIKPLELPITLALALAWDIKSVTRDGLKDFLWAYAAREFGYERAEHISELLLGHDRLMALRRHEHIEPSTFSIINYRESDEVLQRYFKLERRAKSAFDACPISHKSAMFQLVVHPIKASRIYTELRISQAKNDLYGKQRRNTTNVLAKRVLTLFEDDWNLAEEYHNNPWSEKKWNHIVKQPHYGYSWSTWRAPSRDMITGLSFVQRRQDSNRINGQMGVAVEGHAGVRPGLINEESDRMQPSRGDLIPGLTLPPLNPYGAQARSFELYSRGTPRLMWTATSDADWICLSPHSGYLLPDAEEDQRVVVHVDWSKVPKDFEGVIHIDVRTLNGEYEQVHLHVNNHRVPPNSHGWIESDGYIAIDPTALNLTTAQETQYWVYPFLGRTITGSIGLSPNVNTHIEWLEYPIFISSDQESVTVHLYFGMTLDTNPGVEKLYDLAIDDSVQERIPLLETTRKGDLPVGWSSAVQDGVWIRKHKFKSQTRGTHWLRCRPLVPGILLEKVVVDLGGLRESLLGPPTSTFVAPKQTVQNGSGLIQNGSASPFDELDGVPVHNGHELESTE